MAISVVVAEEMAHDVAGTITSIATLVTALGGIIVILLNQRRHSSKLDRNQNTSLNVERAVNHVDEEVATNGTPTLGQRLVQVQQEVKQNAIRNNEDHKTLFAEVNSVTDRLKANHLWEKEQLEVKPEGEE